jgi:hypothetical protein
MSTCARCGRELPASSYESGKIKLRDRPMLLLVTITVVLGVTTITSIAIEAILQTDLPFSSKFILTVVSTVLATLVISFAITRVLDVGRLGARSSQRYCHDCMMELAEAAPAAVSASIEVRPHGPIDNWRIATRRKPVQGVAREEIWFCPNCGNLDIQGSRVCGKCGKPLPGFLEFEFR